MTYPAIPLLAAASLLLPLPRWWDGIAGAVAGYAVLRRLSDGYFWLTGREGMGYGDAKLLALIGAVLGWQGLIPTLFLASVQGTVAGLALAATGRGRVGDPGGEGPDDGEAGDGATEAAPAEPPTRLDRLRYTRIPFGPFLSLGALEALLFADRLAAIWPVL
jgi:leader peptidase (prepilin peptidase)/N-methyltransferase